MRVLERKGSGGACEGPGDPRGWELCLSVELVVVCEWPDLQPGYAGKQGQTGDSKHED